MCFDVNIEIMTQNCLKSRHYKWSIDFLRLLQQAGFDRHEKINTGNPMAEESQGLGRG